MHFDFPFLVPVLQAGDGKTFAGDHWQDLLCSVDLLSYKLNLERRGDVKMKGKNNPKCEFWGSYNVSSSRQGLSLHDGVSLPGIYMTPGPFGVVIMIWQHLSTMAPIRYHI